MKSCQQLVLFMITFLAFCSIYSVCDKSSDQATLNSQTNLSKDVLFENWVSYFKYQNSTLITRPREFFVNQHYFSQRVKYNELTKTDNKGKRLSIPNKNAFFASLNKNHLNLFTSRDNIASNMVDSINIVDIAPIPMDVQLSGGIRDLFEIENLGSCLLIITHHEATGLENWIICIPTKAEKKSLISKLLKIKLDIQKSQNKVYTKNDLDQTAISGSSSTLKDNAGEDENQNGFWIILQDWTECNLKCGGGTSYLHKMCIPPRGTGSPCPGAAVETKPCNTNPCQAVISVVNSIGGPREINKPPIVKYGTISSRPQRFEKCIIKESDLFLEDIDAASQTKLKIPVRLLMNNQTISVYSTDHYTDSIASFELQSANLKVSKDSSCCFSIENEKLSKLFCGYQQQCSDENQQHFINTWTKDFNLFKNECYTGKITSLLDTDDEAKLQESTNQKINELLAQSESKKSALAKEKSRVRNALKVSEKMQNTQSLGVQAILKETNVEELIRQEERQRESEELKNLRINHAKQLSKLKQVQENIEANEEDIDLVVDEHESTSAIKQINEEFSKKILQKRNQFKEYLAKLKQMNELEKSKVESEIKTVRQKITQSLLKTQKVGDIENCKVGKYDEEKRIIYCDKAFADDYLSNQSCKQKTEFCYICCDEEFGQARLTNRENCFNECDKV